MQIVLVQTAQVVLYGNMTSAPRDIRLPFMVTQAEADAIDQWRYDSRVASRAEAMRILLRRGLAPPDGPIVAPVTPTGPGIAPTDPGIAARLAEEHPYPARTVAGTPADAVKELGARIPVRLKIQISWLAKVKGRHAQAEIIEILEAGFASEITRLKINI